ncbi:MAG: GNAT family N-acetyltransferase [Candidatus Omnitrophota bacterium]
MRSVIVGPAGSKDIPALVELLELLFSQEKDFQPDRKKQHRALALILEDPGAGHIFVARWEERIVGMVSLLVLISTAEGGRVLLLEDLIVHPDFRKQGLGTLLLRHVITFARREKFSRITLLTDPHNASARGLYRRHGFEPSSMVPLRLHLS